MHLQIAETTLNDFDEIWYMGIFGSKKSIKLGLIPRKMRVLDL